MQDHSKIFLEHDTGNGPLDVYWIRTEDQILLEVSGIAVKTINGKQVAKFALEGKTMSFMGYKLMNKPLEQDAQKLLWVNPKSGHAIFWLRQDMHNINEAWQNFIGVDLIQD